MKKTKHFNISVPELGDTPDITHVSNAISDLEDATAGTLEIMKAEMQGTKITLTSVSRKTKRTGYYEGMSIRFKSPQDIEPNYLKTISVDGLGDQTLSVEYKVNRNEYIDIVYEGNKFTAHPVVVQKTDSVSNNSSILVGTAKAVKTAYDKASNAEGIANTKEPIINKKTGFNLDKSDSVTSNSSSTLATSAAVKTAYDKGVEALNKANQAQSSANKAQSTADGKVSKSGDTINGKLRFENVDSSIINSIDTSKITGGWAHSTTAWSVNNSKIFECGIFGSQLTPQAIYWGNKWNDSTLRLYFDGSVELKAKNLQTSSKEVVEAINELNSKIATSCPYNVGDIYITTRSENPSSIWLGTTWDKIEGRFLLGTSGGVGAGSTGGSMSKSISVANLPSHNHSGSQSEHSHYMFANTTGGSQIIGSNVKENAPSYKASLRAVTDRDDYLIAGNAGTAAYGRTSNASGGVSVGYTGSGSALDITPSYYTVHIWKRRG